MENSILEILTQAEGIVKTAKKHKHTLSGSGFYASKFLALHAESIVAINNLEIHLRRVDDTKIKDAVKKIRNDLDVFFQAQSKPTEKSAAKNEISFLFKTIIVPAITAVSTHAPTDDLFPLELVKGTRGYIEKIAEQACGSYDQGWYDASAVMIRRLLEILIIEAFEAHSLTAKIQKPDGTFFFLQDLVSFTLSESTWTLGRNVKKALPNLKDIGNQSAHGRRYTARKNDLEDVRRDIRLTVEELVILSKLRK